MAIPNNCGDNKHARNDDNCGDNKHARNDDNCANARMATAVTAMVGMVTRATPPIMQI